MQPSPGEKRETLGSKGATKGFAWKVLSRRNPVPSPPLSVSLSTYPLILRLVIDACTTGKKVSPFSSLLTEIASVSPRILSILAFYFNSHRNDTPIISPPFRAGMERKNMGRRRKVSGNILLPYEFSSYPRPARMDFFPPSKQNFTFEERGGCRRAKGGKDGGQDRGEGSIGLVKSELGKSTRIDSYGLCNLRESLALA